MTIEPGTTLGRYQILAPLGHGGMATVYKAYQPGLERMVALKVLRPAYVSDPEFLERFRTEARAIARLRHPHIVQVFDFAEEGGQVFLAMEFIEGGTLKARLLQLAREGQALPPREVTRIVGEIAEALAVAHAQGIVHRDVKPSNVMLGHDGKAVVTDFGIAKILAAAGQTQTGVGIGTPEYMSPEQGQGHSIDQRSDIYSLGVLAYELLTGRVPFSADTPLAVMLAHVRDPLPLPSRINPAIGSRTEQVLLRALAKDPAARYESAPDLAEALKAAVAEEAKGQTARTAAAVGPLPARAAVAARPRIPRLRIPRLPTAALVALAILAAAGLGVVLVPRVAAPSPPPDSLPRFALLFEAALDAAGSDVAARAVCGGPGCLPDPSYGEVRFVEGAVELTARSLGSGGGSNVTFRRQPPARYVGEAVLLLAASTPGFGFDWRVAVGERSEHVILIDASQETIRLRYVDGSNAPVSLSFEELTPPVYVRGMQARRPFSVGIVIDGSRFALFLDGAEVAKGTDPRLGREPAPMHFRANAGGPEGSGTMSIRALRLYAVE